MTVTSDVSTALYSGNGVTTVFPVPFYFLVNGDVLVQKLTGATGVISTLVLNSDYTLTGAGVEAGGSLTMAVAPLTGDEIYVSRNVDIVQETAYPSNSPFPASSHEMALDRLTMIAQQVNSQVGLSLKKSALANTYDLGTSVLVNSGNAVNQTDVPNLGQVQAAVVAGAAAQLALPIGASLVGYLTGTVKSFLDSLSAAGSAVGAALLGFLQAGTGATTRTAQAKLRERVSVLDFGAVGNGTANDGPAIVAALTYCASTNKELFLPAGTYRILTYVSLPSNTKLVGEPGTIVHIDPACTLGTVNIGGTNRAFYASGVSGISFKGIIFESVTTGLTQQVNVALNATSNIRVDDCTFRNFGNGSFYCQGLVMLGCSDIIVRASKFTGNSGDGLAIGNSSSSFQVFGNTVSGNGDFGIAITLICNEGTIANNVVLNNTSAGIGTDRCTNIAITGNTLVNNAYGIRVCRFAADSNLNQYVAISGNVVNGAGTLGISVEQCTSPGGVTVVGNSVVGVTGAGISVADSCVVTVNGNAVYSTTGASVLVQSFNASYETGRITIVGNSFNNGTYGIQQVTGPGTITSITVMGNDVNNMSVGLYSFLSGKANYLMTNTSFMDISNTLNFPSGISAGSATAGGGTAIPATTKGYLVMFLGGTQIKVPYYAP